MFRRRFALALLGVVAISPSLARALEASEVGLALARLAGASEGAEVEAIRVRTDWDDVAETAIRRGSDPSWWRLRLTPAPSSEHDWIVAIKEVYDGRVVIYAPPHYRPEVRSTYDPDLRQLGSRHRLTARLPAASLDQPVYVQVQEARAHPLRVAAMPLDVYLHQDLARARFTSAIVATLLLLGVVAAIYAFALRRRLLLLFTVWVGCSAIYVLAMSGEIAWVLGNSRLLPHAISASLVAVNVGALAAFHVLMGLAELPRYHPRFGRLMHALMAVLMGWTVVVALQPQVRLAGTVSNLLLLVLSVLLLGGIAARVRAGSRQARFFLVGWGVVVALNAARAGCFLRELGTPDWLEYAHPAANAFGALVLVLSTARAARYAERELHVARRVARTDALTRLPNRFELDDSLAELLAASGSSGEPLSLMFLDLDHFKSINDRFGHAVGDLCLVRAALCLRRHVRVNDLIARYGGEEFVVVLPSVPPDRAIAVAEEIRCAIEREATEIDGRPVNLTVSVGVAHALAGESPDSLLTRADEALYRAKRDGRNRVVAEPDPPVRVA